MTSKIDSLPPSATLSSAPAQSHLPKANLASLSHGTGAAPSASLQKPHTSCLDRLMKNTLLATCHYPLQDPFLLNFEALITELNSTGSIESLTACDNKISLGIRRHCMWMGNNIYSFWTPPSPANHQKSVSTVSQLLKRLPIPSVSAKSSLSTYDIPLEIGGTTEKVTLVVNCTNFWYLSSTAALPEPSILLVVSDPLAASFIRDKVPLVQLIDPKTGLPQTYTVMRFFPTDPRVVNAHPTALTKGKSKSNAPLPRTPISKAPSNGTHPTSQNIAPVQSSSTNPSQASSASSNNTTSMPIAPPTTIVSSVSLLEDQKSENPSNGSPKSAVPVHASTQTGVNAAAPTTATPSAAPSWQEPKRRKKKT